MNDMMKLKNFRYSEDFIRFIISYNGIPVPMPVSLLDKQYAIIENPPWGLGDSYAEALHEMTLECIAAKRYDGRPYHEVNGTDNDTIEYHAKRIAYLVACDSRGPILIDLDENNIYDGNHRLYAAIIAGRDYIQVDFEGQILSKQPSYKAAYYFDL